MGGNLTVRSVPLVGTTFTVELPAAEEDIQSDHGPLLDLSEPSGSATVLYVEDNEVNVVLVKQIMGLRPSWHLVVANSGAQALERVREHRPICFCWTCIWAT